MTKKVVWEQWKDPLMSNQTEDVIPEYDNDYNSGLNKPVPQPFIHTQFGLLAIMNHMSASNHFDFWMMHTNFNITHDFAIMIEALPGVETIEVYTRYRMRLGFPKSGLFKSNEIMNHITEIIKQLDTEKTKLLLSGFEEQIQQKVLETTGQVSEKYPIWAIWVAPNGKIDIIGAEVKDEIYEHQFSVITNAQEEVGGTILTSEEY